MGEEDGEVDGPRRPRPREVPEPRQRVVDQVGGQEQDRAGQRRDHDVAVGDPPPLADQDVARTRSRAARAFRLALTAGRSWMLSMAGR